MKEGLNVVHLGGYIKGTPALQKAKNNEYVLRFKLSSPRPLMINGKCGTVSDIFTIVVWGWKAKNLSDLLHEGSHIYVGGCIRYSTYRSKKTKSNVTSGYVEAKKVVFIGKVPGKQ